MSKHDDHSHLDHPHDHGHDHDHQHDHDHPHPAASPVDAAPGSEPDSIVLAEDASTRALSDALQSSFVIVKFVMAVLIVLFFASGVFTVPPQEKAVIFRFGKPISPDQLLGPGLHWSFPSPIDEVVRIPIGQLQTVRSTVGWYGTTAEIEASGQEPPARPSLNPIVDGYTLTGDGNIIHIRATMRYRISDPLVYVFNFVSASNVVQSALDNALFYASAQFTVDKALRKDVVGLKEKILARVNELINQQKLGIVLDPLDIAVSPPLFVKPFFNEVTSAEQEQGTAINTAQGYANALLSRAIGESNQVVNAGQTDRTRLLQSVRSEADTLTARLPGYQKNPRLFEQRLLTETWQRILTNAQDKYFLPDRADGGSRELRLLLNREMQKPAVTQTNQ